MRLSEKINGGSSSSLLESFNANLNTKQEILEESDNSKHAILSRVFAKYPDISEEDEDYLNSLPLDGLINEIYNRGWEEVLKESEDNEGIDVNNLTKEQLWKLREEIVLGSLYIDDYKNSYGIEPKAVCDFFDAFIEDSQQDDDGNSNGANVEDFDNPENLYNFYLACEYPFGNLEVTESEDQEDEVEIANLAKEIYDWYDSDIGIHFDEVKENEDEIYNIILEALESRDKECIELFINNIGESDLEEDKKLVEKLKALLNLNEEIYGNELNESDVSKDDVDRYYKILHKINEIDRNNRIKAGSQSVLHDEMTDDMDWDDEILKRVYGLTDEEVDIFKRVEKDMEKSAEENSIKYELNEEILKETTNVGIRKRRNELYEKTRQKLKDAGDPNWENITGLRGRLPDEEVDAYEKEYKEIGAIDMIHSILTYTSKDNWNVDYLMNNKYMKDYIVNLGEDRVKEIAQEEVDEFINNATVEQGTYTDSEGCTYNTTTFKNESENLDKEHDEYLDKMGKKYERFCKNLDIDKEDLDDALYALDELEGEFGDAEGEYQELREFIYNELLESEQLTESKKYNVYITCEQPEGVYNTKLVGTVDSIEKAEDKCRELEAETGCGAHFIEAPASDLEGVFEVWQNYYENGEVTTEMVQRFDNYLDALKFANNLKRDPDCEAWVKEIKESEKLTEGTSQKRIARFGEFDNGHVLHSWYKMTDEEAEEKAKQASIENPTDVYYVAHDDIMNPNSGVYWYKGKSYSNEEVNEIRRKEKENIEIKD